VTVLPATSRATLAKILGMLGSDHQNERDNAALAAHRLVTQAGLTWEQVIMPAAVEKPLPELATWHKTVNECLARPGSLTPWEVKFLLNLSRFWRLSVKQRDVLSDIADRVLKREAT
jgi:hypothetical protein